MSGVRDLFFDEFYEELQRVAGEIKREDDAAKLPLLRPEVEARWNHYTGNPEARAETLVSVDGGIQESDFAYGDFVAAGRAIALIHRPGTTGEAVRRVRLYVGQVYEDRDKGFIPGYVRTICEYDAAYGAARRVLEAGGRPLVLMDGSLYLGRFPYAIREYRHHPELLAELFESVARLRNLARDEGFPVVGVTKDSSVFYLYMALLREAIRRAGLGANSEKLDGASSPLDLVMRSEVWTPEEREELAPFMEERPLCDPPLVEESTATEGYTTPLYLAPSIYYSQQGEVLVLVRQIDKYIEPTTAARLKEGVKGFFKTPGVVATYWKPKPKGRPFRVDVLASSLGRSEAWDTHQRNVFLDSYPREAMEGVLNHLAHWYCNEVEYNIPLKQADTLARFDRDLYRRKYEPFIIRRLEEAGMDVTGKRRVIREG